MKILAVDDDESIRELLTMILAEAGITDVTLASSAGNALRVIAAQPEPFECFLLDIQMPGGDGIELCSNIRKLPAYQKTPIIMLTAMQEKSFINDAFVAGATDYTTKPFDIAELCTRVRMAKLLVDEQRKVRELAASSGRSFEDATGHLETDFTTRLDLGGVKGLVSKQAFENYLGQLSRTGLQSSRFFAIHVQDGRKVFDRGTPSEFGFALRHVADAAMTSPILGVVLMCYMGSGNFICCSNAATLETIERLEGNIQDILDDKDLTYDDGSPLDVEIAVGAAVQPLSSEALQLDDLEPQAIKRAMVRIEEKRSVPAVLNIRRIRI